MHEVRELLERATARPVNDPPLPKIKSRGRRRRIYSRVATAAAVPCLAVLVGMAAMWLLEGPEVPVIGEPDRTPTPPQTSEETETPEVGDAEEDAEAPEAGETEEETEAPEAGEAENVPLATDALLGVPFGEDPGVAIDRIAQAAQGTVVKDEVERAAGALPCHGPNGPTVQELRSVVIEADGVTLWPYIADGAFMGYQLAGSDPRYVTSEGVGLGSRETDLVAAYGDRVRIQPGISEPYRWAFVEVPGSVLPIQFDYQAGGPVQGVTVGARCSD